MNLLGYFLLLFYSNVFVNVYTTNDCPKLRQREKWSRATGEVSSLLEMHIPRTPTHISLHRYSFFSEGQINIFPIFGIFDTVELRLHVTENK
jgi:hypothetical protein